VTALATRDGRKRTGHGITSFTRLSSVVCRPSFVCIALALAAGILFAADGTSARPAGAMAARGPVFGLHAGIAAHRPFRAAQLNRGPARLGWQLHRWHRHRLGGRNRGDASAIYGGSAASYYPSDVTGTLPEGPAVYAPPVIPPPPSERIGCFAKGYDVPAEFGGVARVVVTRC